MGILDTLPTPDDMYRERAGKPLLKGKTRLQETVEARPLTKVDEREFKRQVWIRDKNRCVKCGRKVQKVIGRVPERGEVNHLHGRTGDLRFEVRAACLLCLTCHEQFTGRIGEKWVVIASKTFTTRQGTFTDATYPIRFERVA